MCELSGLASVLSKSGTTTGGRGGQMRLSALANSLLAARRSVRCFSMAAQPAAMARSRGGAEGGASVVAIGGCGVGRIIGSVYSARDAGKILDKKLGKKS